MSDWKATLERAATLSSEATRLLPSFVTLLEAVVAKRATARDVEAELGTVVDRKPSFVDALDAALRAGYRGPELAAARVVLAELPRVLDAIVSIPPFGPEPDTDGGLAATLARLQPREPSAPPSMLRCPRCGSRRIITQHTDALGPREIEARCDDCGLYGAWTEGRDQSWRAASLTDGFAAYLRGNAREPEPLAALLGEAGLSIEALIARDGWQPATGEWSRIFVGRLPPSDAKPGELWLDSVEVMPMVLVEEPTFRADPPRRPVWLAIRPVARWQFRAFVAVAPIVARTVQVALPVTPLDPQRLDGPEHAPITDVIEAEAELYAAWFGKVVGSRDAWQGAAHTLGERAAALWTPGLREWIGELCSADESVRARIGPEEVDLSPDEDYQALLDDEARILVSEGAHEPTTGLRTVIGMRLLTEISDSFRPFFPITVDQVYAR